MASKKRNYTVFYQKRILTTGNFWHTYCSKSGHMRFMLPADIHDAEIIVIISFSFGRP